MAEFHIAQMNVGRALYPLDDPRMADFMDNLALINGLGEATVGFVWRLADEDGAGATSIKAYDDPNIIINLTVWENLDALYAFTYKSDHGKYFARRREWFDRDNSHLVIWYIPAGELPTPEEGKARLEYLAQHGPTPYAFNFKQRYSVDDMLAYTAQEK